MKKFVLVSLLLCLAASGNSRPGRAVSLIPGSADLLDRLKSEGWQEISPGVLRRIQEGGTVETLRFGAEGLQFQLEELKADLVLMRHEYARNPSRSLRRAIRIHREQILRTEEALEMQASSDSSGLSIEALTAATPNCLVNYDASAEAYPTSQGAGAGASAYFKNDCLLEGDAYVLTKAVATLKDGTSMTVIKNDPLAADEAGSNAYFGSNVRAIASVGIKGTFETCYSKAKAYVRYYEGLYYDAFAENRSCSGSVDIRPFPVDAPSNLPLPTSPPLHPNSAAIVANLNSGAHKVHAYDNSRTIYNASAGTPRTIICTKALEGTCGLSLQQVPINASWIPSSGAGRTMSVIDYTNRKVYDFYQVAQNPDGTVMINSDGTVRTGWGEVTDLDGSGQAGNLGDSNLSYLFGTVRISEMENAKIDPANAIRHALAFTSSYICSTYRYPATKSSGTLTDPGCLPMGSRVFLDSSADCSAVSPIAERAVCHALQKYGAYAVGSDSPVFAMKFETPTGGQPGGSGPDPYPSVGISGATYYMSHIPWATLKVAADCRCSSSELSSTSGRPFAQKAPSNVLLPASPAVDPNSSAIVMNLNSGQHKANISGHGRPVFDASVGTPRAVVCTAGWGTCGLSLQPVPIHASWKPATGSEGAMTVIDYVNRKVYDFYGVATNLNGTVLINSNGTVSTAWGEVSDLDGSGQVGRLPSGNLSYLFGLVRIFEMERAAGAFGPENAIQHALAFTGSFICSSYRYPATAGESSTAPGCIPAGARVFLDSSADCSTISSVGEKAICYALQKYGAYALGSSTTVFAVKLEAPRSGIPGGSGPDPYPSVGLDSGYDMVNIPWSQLKVAADCQCTPY